MALINLRAIFFCKYVKGYAVMDFNNHTNEDIIKSLEAEIAKARSEMNHAQDDLEKAQNRLRFTLAAIHFLNNRYKG